MVSLRISEIFNANRFEQTNSLYSELFRLLPEGETSIGVWE